MRTTIAIIRLVLRTNKVLSTGEFPIMLRCSFHGMKEKSTGYSCSKAYWDSRNERVKKGYPNYLIINANLKKIKDEAIAKRDNFIMSGELYNSSMVLEREERDINSSLFGSLVSRYISEKGLESKTIEKWNIVKRNVIKFAGRDLLINEVNESFCRRYCRWLEGNGLSSGSIKSYMGKVVALLHYAVSLGLLSDYPLVGWKYHLDYRESKSELYIHYRSMDFLINMLLEEMVVMDGGLYSYKDGVIEGLMDIHSSLYAHYLYIIGFYLKGLAPVDISLLKKCDIKVVEIKGISCYSIDGRRSKTGVGYKIRLRKDDILCRVLFDTMLMFSSGEHFLPTLEGYVGNDIRKRVNNVYCYHSSHLVNWFRECNERIVSWNVENGDNIPLIDLDCRYYSYRHSYIMGEILKGGVNLLKLATETGKSVATLHQYLSYLNDMDLI